MDARKEKLQLAERQQRLEAFIQGHPDLLEELFCFTDPEVRQKALAGIKHLDLHAVTMLCDRATYLSMTRIVHVKREVPRCGSKVIYDEKGAHRKANRIRETGRGRMRVYACPHCHGFHLTHKAHKDADQQAA
jgi:hypothetical protein